MIYQVLLNRIIYYKLFNDKINHNYNQLQLFIIAPFIEEFIYRFLSYKILKNYLINEYIIMYITITIYSLMQINIFKYNRLEIIIHFIITLHIRYCLYLTEDLWVAMLIHSLINLTRSPLNHN